jgi:hypothetical protein
LILGSDLSETLSTLAAFDAIEYYPGYGEGILSAATVHRYNRFGINR